MNENKLVELKQSAVLNFDVVSLMWVVKILAHFEGLYNTSIMRQKSPFPLTKEHEIDRNENAQPALSIFSPENGHDAEGNEDTSHQQKTVADIHREIRELLALNQRCFAEKAHMHRTSVACIENPNKAVDLRLHATASMSLRAIDELSTGIEKSIKGKIENLRQQFMDALLKPFHKATERFLLRHRLFVGQDEFKEKTGRAVAQLRARIYAGGITPFSELVEIIQKLYLQNSDHEEQSKKDLWNHPLIQEARQAYIDDHIEYGSSEAIAKLMSLLEFCGYSFIKNDLRRVGLGLNTIKRLNQNRLPKKIESLAVLREKAEQTLGKEDADKEFQFLEDAIKKQRKQKTLFKMVRQLMNERNIEPSEVLRHSGLDPLERCAHEEFRLALERGPSKKIPLVSLIALISGSEEEQSNLEKRARKELRERSVIYRKKKASTISTEMQFCGLSIDDLPLNESERDAIAELRNGEATLQSEKDICNIIYNLAMEKRVKKPLEKWIADEEPTTIPRMTELLVSRRKYEGRKLAKESHVSEETFTKIRNEELVPEIIVLRELCKAAEVVLPARLEVENLLALGSLKEREGNKPLGRALEILIHTTHKHAKTFHRENVLTSSVRDFQRNLEESRLMNSMNATIRDEVVEKIETSDRDALRQFIQLLQDTGQTKKALHQWLCGMKLQGNEQYLSAYKSLRSIVQSTQVHPSEIPHKEKSVQELLDRKHQLHRWKYGLTNEDNDQKEDLSFPDERSARDLLRLLPGVTKDDILTTSIDELENEERKHLETILRLTELKPQDKRIAIILQKLLQGSKKMHCAFYGDTHKPCTEKRILVLRLRASLQFRKLDHERDNKGG